MDDPVSKIPEHVKIELNQNLWVFISSSLFLGLSEYYNLCMIFWLSTVVVAISTISLIITVVYYTYHYCWKKLRQVQSMKK